MAWRTLGRRVRVAAEATNGNPVIVVDGARLVLPPGARHFRQLVTCTRCGEDFASAPVLNAGQLTRELSQVCGRCMVNLP